MGIERNLFVENICRLLARGYSPSEIAKHYSLPVKRFIEILNSNQKLINRMQEDKEFAEL